jgi:hypothetical protein
VIKAAITTAPIETAAASLRANAMEGTAAQVTNPTKRIVGFFVELSSSESLGTVKVNPLGTRSSSRVSERVGVGNLAMNRPSLRINVAAKEKVQRLALEFLLVRGRGPLQC